MALWLFRRKSRRKRERSGTLSEDELERPVPRRQTAPDTTHSAVTLRQQSVKKQRTEPHKLHRRARTYSFEAGQGDFINVGRKKSAQRLNNPLPPLRQNHVGYGAHEENSSGGSAMEDDVFGRVPTLHANKRDGQHLNQRKSSKRRKNAHDREREAELKAMSNFVPVRPSTETWMAGRPMQRETRKVRTGLGFGSRWDKEQHPSDISLPSPESINSNMSSDSEPVAYKVSALDVLAPKPTLRYASNPRWGPHSSLGAVPQRIPSQGRKLLEKEPIPEATLRAHKRIHDLADDLSAGDLRQLMERDQRRRERKRQKEQEKMDRRLARRLEKEKAGAEDGTEPPLNMERGVIGREAVGLGIDTTSAVVTSSKRRPSDVSPKQLGKRPVEDDADANEPEHEDRVPTPLNSFYRTNSIPAEPPSPSPSKEPEEPVPPLVQSPKYKGFLKTKKSRSDSPQSEREKSEISETLHKGSESSSSRGPLSWSSIFRWGNKAKRSSGPSSFSNTSRDSMATQSQPAAALAAGASQRKMSGGIPKRTLSRFREDLPDFLLSPSNSGNQSREADLIPPAIEEQETPPPPPDEASAEPTPVTEQHEELERQEQEETPPSDNHSFEPTSTRHTPTSWYQHEDYVEPSPEPQQSMSLASIDSEGSWLSGRLGSRSRSSQLRQHHDSASHSYRSKHRHQLSGGSDETSESREPETVEEDAAVIAEDEYLNEYTRRSEGGGSIFTNHHMSSGEARPSSDEEDEARWGSVSGRMPTVIHEHAAERIKSREGLLNMYGEEGEGEMGGMEPESPSSPISPVSRVSDLKDEEADLRRATSVNLGRGHARRISAGSAKLLDLSPRSSVDNRSRSLDLMS